jgi:hypothetical protein
MDQLKDVLMVYRQAIRTLWNCAFAPHRDLADWNARDTLNQIKRLLFQEMICARFSELEGVTVDFESPIERIAISCAPQAGSAPILINNPRPNDRNSYWDHPVDRFDAESATLRFVSFFDWYELGFIDLQFYRVRIVYFEALPEVVGRDALVEVRHGEPLLV